MFLCVPPYICTRTGPHICTLPGSIRFAANAQAVRTGHNEIMLACQARAVGVGYGYNADDLYATRWVADFGDVADGDIACEGC